MSSKNGTALTVGEWYTRHSEALQLRLLGPAVGFDRTIREPTVNRPGLALSGFFSYFAHKRIQVLGSAELSYLKSLPIDEAQSRIRELCTHRIPCLIFSRGAHPPQPLLDEAAAAEVAVFRTPMVTMKFINAATRWILRRPNPNTAAWWTFSASAR
jgi:HPr kinase/phosphorylase